MLPMKFVRRWAWENTWLVFSIVSLIVIPWALALWRVHDPLALYSGIPWSVYWLPLLLGAGWGVAQVLFGLSIARLGLALGFAIIIGLGALGGTLVPLVAKNSAVLGTSRGAFILVGVVVMLSGIVVSAIGGRQRELAAGQVVGVEARNYGAALATAVFCGILAPMLNYSFAFGQDISEAAVRAGTPVTSGAYAVWPVTMTGGFVPNLVYCLYLLGRNRTWAKFRATTAGEAGLASAMGLLWMGSMATYGVAAVYLGALGTSAGWALFQIFNIMTASLSGILTGEWKSAPPSATRRLWIGLSLLAAATALIAAGNR
jgi:L-rhamnose-H+ transport protein